TEMRERFAADILANGPRRHSSRSGQNVYSPVPQPAVLCLRKIQPYGLRQLCRTDTVVVLLVRIGARTNQILHRLSRIVENRIGQRCIAINIARFNIRSRLHQPPSCLPLIFLRCKVQRGPTAIVRSVHISPALDQKLDQPGVAKESGADKWRVSVVVPNLDRLAGIQCSGNGVDIALFDGEEQPARLQAKAMPLLSRHGFASLCLRLEDGSSDWVLEARYRNSRCRRHPGGAGAVVATS